MPIATSGLEPLPLMSALMSGEETKSLYKASWKGEREQKTTCSYLTGTVRAKAYDQPSDLGRERSPKMTATYDTL